MEHYVTVVEEQTWNNMDTISVLKLPDAIEYIDRSIKTFHIEKKKRIPSRFSAVELS